MVYMKIESNLIYGSLIDKQGRCVHYNSKLDIISNRCGQCGKLYACYKCHNQLEDHSFLPVKKDEKDSVLCGVCKKMFSYIEYAGLCACPDCKSEFNPRCALHKNIYAQ